MAHIRTLLGDIYPDELGTTYAHEHIMCSPPYWMERGQSDLLLDDPEKSCEEVALFKNAGGRSIVDATVADYGRCIKEVAQISIKTGVHVVGTAGFNKDMLWTANAPGGQTSFAEWINDKCVDEIGDYLTEEVESGIDGTRYRAGLLKYGTSYNRISEKEEKVMRAVVRAQKITRAPVYTHLENGTMAVEQIAILQREGFDLQNIAFGHMDLNPDPYIHEKVVRTGAYICFDGVGKPKYHPESLVLDLIFTLVKKGYQKQILISGDIARKSGYHSYSRAQGLPYILASWRPRLVEEAGKRGFEGERLAEDFFLHNPKSFLTFK